MKSATIAFILLALFACASTSSGPPERIADEIVGAVDDGRPGKAAELFETLEGNAAALEKAYPILYTAASERYELGDTAGSAAILRLMSEHYPDAVAVHEALVYSLFLERARQEPPNDELVREIEAVVATVRERSADAPVWLDLVDVQLAIDGGRLNDARSYYEHFLARWNGTPASLVVYVDDIDRYLASH